LIETRFPHPFEPFPLPVGFIIKRRHKMRWLISIMVITGLYGKSLNVVVGPKGKTITIQNFEINIPKGALSERESLTIEVFIPRKLNLPDKFIIDKRGIRIYPENIVFKKSVEIKLRKELKNYFWAYKIGKGIVLLANSEYERGTLRAKIYHGGEYLAVEFKGRWGIRGKIKDEESGILLIGDLLIGDYLDKLSGYLKKSGFKGEIYTFLYPTWKSFEENAVLLSSELGKLNVSKFDVVAFGTGGLILAKYMIDEELYLHNIGKAIIFVGTPFYGTSLASLKNAMETGYLNSFYYIDALSENASDLLPNSNFLEEIKREKIKIHGAFYDDKLEENHNTASLSGLIKKEDTLPEIKEGDGLVSFRSIFLTPLEPEPFLLDHFELLESDDVYETIAGLLKIYRDKTWPEIFIDVFRGKSSEREMIEFWKEEIDLYWRSKANFEILLSYNKNVLKSCPPNAILITNGDMDTYPVWYIQEVLGFRKDVLVVNRSLLNIPENVFYLKKKGLPVNLSEDEISSLKGVLSDSIIKILVHEKNRPVVFAITVSNPQKFGVPLVLSGLIYKIGAGEIDLEETENLLKMYDYKPIFETPYDSINSIVKRMLMNYVSLYFRIAMEYESRGMYNKALEKIDGAINFYPEMGWLYIKRAEILKELGRDEELEENYRRALNYGFNNFGILKEVANFYMERGMKEEAIRIVAKWISEHPEDGEAIEFLKKISNE
jgi:tetratricopeptide (TPR) repeat protein